MAAREGWWGGLACGFAIGGFGMFIAFGGLSSISALGFGIGFALGCRP
jgi:hypothetical protein